MLLDDKSRIALFQRAIVPAGHADSLPRSLLFFAHPDDETIALGARLGNFAGGHIVHATDGAPRDEHGIRHNFFATLDDYREARRAELATVLAAAGAASVTRECLRIHEGEASHTLAALTRATLRILRQHRPEVVFTHPYEGGHPDHDACAFAVHHAVQFFDSSARPLIVEAAFCHAGKGRPEQGRFLPAEQAMPTAEMLLSAEEIRRKRSLLSLFVTQRQRLAEMPLPHERFRVAPDYDFTRPPHDPPVLYDSLALGTTSEEFAQLARHARAILSRNPAA